MLAKLNDGQFELWGDSGIIYHGQNFLISDLLSLKGRPSTVYKFDCMFLIWTVFGKFRRLVISDVFF